MPDEKKVYLTESAARAIKRDHEKLNNMRTDLTVGPQRTSDFQGAAPKPIWFFNESSEQVPRYGVMAVTGYTDAITRDALSIDKPSTTFYRRYVVNGIQKVSPQRLNAAQSTPLIKALYDTGTPEFGETWGPKPGQWELSKGYPGFTMIGVLKPDISLALVVPEPIVSLVGKTDGAISAADDVTPGSGTVSVYVRPSSDLVDSTTNVTALNIGGEIAADTFVHLKWYAGAWWVVQTGLGYDRCKASVKGAFTIANSTFTVDNVVAMKGTSPLNDPEDTAEELTVQNTFGWDGDDNATVFIEWDQAAENWVAYQVECAG